MVQIKAPSFRECIQTAFEVENWRSHALSGLVNQKVKSSKRYQLKQSYERGLDKEFEKELER